MIKIELKNNKGFSWYSKNNISVKGYFFDKNNKYYEKENLPVFFENITSEDDFVVKIKETNGIFSVVVIVKEQVFIASDTSRMFPLFYYKKDETLSISDDIIFLKNKFNVNEIDKQAASEFKSAGYTIGNKTLLKNVFQLQSSEYIIFNNNEIKNNGFFFSYSVKKYNKASFDEQYQQIVNSFENTFKRMIKTLNGRHVTLPLSGGYDSRLIAAMLKKFDYDNVTCFTYGKKDNFEVSISKAVAKQLSYKWIFIEYDENQTKEFINDTFKEYAHFVGKYSSMPMLQEYFSVKYLKEKNQIPEDSIFIPGHSGDLLGGSQFVKVFGENLTFSDIPDLILKKKFYYNKVLNKHKSLIRKEISKNIFDFDINAKQNFAFSVFEDFDIKEKIAKFIINSSSVYNFFGYEHRLPFWDNELLSFFKNVPFKYKKMKLLFDDVLQNNYFTEFDINFAKELKPTQNEIRLQAVKNIIKPFLPSFIIKKLRMKNDWLNSYLSSSQMIEFLKQQNINIKTNARSNNEITIQWYLASVENDLF